MSGGGIGGGGGSVQQGNRFLPSSSPLCSSNSFERAEIIMQFYARHRHRHSEHLPQLETMCYPQTSRINHTGPILYTIYRYTSYIYRALYIYMYTCFNFIINDARHIFFSARVTLTSRMCSVPSSGLVQSNVTCCCHPFQMLSNHFFFNFYF